MMALKKFADFKNDYRINSKDTNFNGSVVDGKLYNGLENKTLFKDDVIFAIRWTSENAKLYFCNTPFSSAENKSVFSSDDYIFEFKDGKLEFCFNGTHWILE